MNLDDLLLQGDLSLAQILISFLLAFALAYIWATAYRRTHSGIAYTRAFFLTLILIPPIVAMIMMAIGSNVALSLGLVGSLSVIRFRTVIKDTKDMTFLFMSIAIGLTAGANVWLIGIVGTITVTILTVVLSRAGYDRVGSADYILIFRSMDQEPWQHVSDDAQALVTWRQLRGATEVGDGQGFEYTYNIRLAGRATPEAIVNAISGAHAQQVTMIAPENHLDL